MCVSVSAMMAAMMRKRRMMQRRWNVTLTLSTCCISDVLTMRKFEPKYGMLERRKSDR